MSDLHAVLTRIARSVGLDDVYEIPTPETWHAFLRGVSAFIDESELGRHQLERSLETSSQEMRALNDQVRKEKDVLTAVLAALSNGIIHVGRGGTVRYANRAFLAMIGRSELDLGTDIGDLITIQNHAGVEIDTIDVVHRLEPGAVWRDEECTLGVGRRQTSAAIVISPVFGQVGNDKLEGFVVSLADRTDQDRVAARIRKAEVDLDAAEQARVAQASFLANMSHELRTPLNAIIGYSELVAEEAVDFGYTEILPDLDRIQRSGRHLVTLISDVLDMSKIQAGKLELELQDVHVGPVIEQAVEATYPLVRQNGNTFATDIEEMLPLVRADSLRLMQALVNLIGNAGKFTQDGTVTVRASSPSGSSVIIEVIDTGIGIPGDKLGSLFQAFNQADTSTTRKFGGTGLGLTITREFIEAMGGRIEVDSQPGRGSTFRLVFKAQGVSEILPESSRPSQPMVPTRTVATLLIIDDDRATHALIRRHLAETDIAIHSSFSAEEGFKKAKEIQPELLFVDIILPGIDGWSMLEHWVNHATLSAVPFYVVSVVDDRPRAMRAGAKGFLNKPVEGEDLLAAVTIVDPK